MQVVARVGIGLCRPTNRHGRRLLLASKIISGCVACRCYGSASMSEVAALDYRDYEPGETIYYWDEAGQVGSVAYGTSSAWMANIFTSTQ